MEFQAYLFRDTNLLSLFALESIHSPKDTWNYFFKDILAKTDLKAITLFLFSVGGKIIAFIIFDMN